MKNELNKLIIDVPTAAIVLLIVLAIKYFVV